MSRPEGGEGACKRERWSGERAESGLRRETERTGKAGDGEDRVRGEAERVQGDREKRGEGRKGAG